MKYVGKVSTFLTVMAAMAASGSTAFAQRDAAAKPEWRYNTWGNNNVAPSNARAYSYAPATNYAPPAQARSYSYAPQQKVVEQPRAAQQPFQAAPRNLAPAAPVQRSTAPARSYSYQPGTTVYRQQYSNSGDGRMRGWHDAGTKARFDYH